MRVPHHPERPEHVRGGPPVLPTERLVPDTRPGAEAAVDCAALETPLPQGVVDPAAEVGEQVGARLAGRFGDREKPGSLNESATRHNPAQLAQFDRSPTTGQGQAPGAVPVRNRRIAPWRATSDDDHLYPALTRDMRVPRRDGPRTATARSHAAYRRLERRTRPRDQLAATALDRELSPGRTGAATSFCSRAVRT